MSVYSRHKSCAEEWWKKAAEIKSHKKPVCGKCEGIFTFHIMNLVEMQHMEGPNKFCNYYMQLAGKTYFSCVCLAFKSHDFH